MSQTPKYTLPEIERRWLVRLERLPLLGESPRREVQDKYISGGRLRLRAVRSAGSEPVFKLGKKYHAAIGQPANVVSIYLSEGEYLALQLLPGAIARKARYSVAGGSLDVYMFPLNAPAIFEVEFASQVAAVSFEPPVFVGQEVTFDPKYSGFELAQPAAHLAPAT